MLNNATIFKAISKKAEPIFYKPFPTYPYKNIVTGCKMVPNKKEMAAVEDNTFQAFGYRNDDMFFAKRFYREYFVTQKEFILSSLKQIKGIDELNQLENEIVNNLGRILSAHLKDKSKLDSYNRIRKPVDLYIQNIVAMAEELDKFRGRIVEYLFLPMDSWMFKSDIVFEDSDVLLRNGVKRSSTMGTVSTLNAYLDLQNYLLARAEKISHAIGKTFHRAYFDFFWRDRYAKNGTNLFLTNL